MLSRRVELLTLHDSGIMQYSLACRYVEWSSHQPTPSEVYNFHGNLNLFSFWSLRRSRGDPSTGALY